MEPGPGANALDAPHLSKESAPDMQAGGGTGEEGAGRCYKAVEKPVCHHAWADAGNSEASEQNLSVAQVSKTANLDGTRGMQFVILLWKWGGIEKQKL